MRVKVNCLRQYYRFCFEELKEKKSSIFRGFRIQEVRLYIATIGGSRCNVNVNFSLQFYIKENTEIPFLNNNTKYTNAMGKR